MSSQQIGNDYYDSLSSLTVNSRPIIESLTMLAQENTEAAPEIAKAVERRISKAIPSHKLYAFYLLDSICKNVGVPYPSLFGAQIFKLFSQSYSLVDDPTRVRLIKLFRTWKVPNAVTGMPLFDDEQINLIDKFLVKATAPNRAASEPSEGPITKASVLQEIDNLTNLVNSRLLQMPGDKKAGERFTLLQKLRFLINRPGNIQLKELEATKRQLTLLRDDEVMKLNAFKQQQQQQQQQQQPQMPNLSVSQLQGILNKPQNQQQFSDANAQAMFNMMAGILQQNQAKQQQLPQQQPQQQQPQQQQQQQQRPIPRGPSNVRSKPGTSTKSSLGLTNLDFLKGILGPKKAEMAAPKQQKQPSEPPEVVISRFELTQTFVSNHKPSADAVALIYDAKSNQCSNCSKRFPATPQGAEQKALHLDWHFRTNKKLRALSKQIHNRSWFLQDRQWEQFQEDEIVGGNDSGGEIGVELNNRINRRKALTEEELNKKTVAIPDDSDNEVVCGICRDKLVGVFDDDSGEWIWRNATRQKGKVYHYSCWIETKGQNRDRSPERR